MEPQPPHGDATQPTAVPAGGGDSPPVAVGHPPPEIGEASFAVDAAGVLGIGLPVRIGNYLLKRLIATGGMGSVYEAIQDQPRRIVAVKLLRVGRQSAPQQRRFEFESQLLARLRHPAIAQVFEAGTHECGDAITPYFAMEFIPGARAITRYAQDEKLSSAMKLELMANVCDAVHHAHTKGIIHRDLKPGNILIDAQGQPKVIDFGVARAADSDQVSTTLQTDASQLIGTLQYMSPEQCRMDPRQLDARSDVYALGVVLYELLCGRLPYDVTRANVSDATRVIREEPPLRPSLVDPSLKGDVETVLLKALQKDRERRYASADKLAADIRHVLAGEPIEAQRDSAIYVARAKLKKLAVRHGPFTHALAGIAALLAASLIVDSIERYFPLSEHVTGWLTNHVSLQHAPVDKLTSVRMVVLQDGTDIAKLAADHNIAGVDPARIPSLRRLHALLMNRLVDSQARVVAFDIVFRNPSDLDDRAFVAGVENLRARGIPVVVAQRDWTPRGEGARPQISSRIASNATSGACPMNASTSGPWSLQIAAGARGTMARPAFALASAAAYWRPLATPAYAIDAGLGVVEISYEPPADPSLAPQPINAPTVALPGSSAMDPRFDHVALTRTARFGDYSLRTIEGLHPEDIVGHYMLQVPPQRVLDASTIDYAAVLSADSAQLRKWFGNCVVVVGDACTSSRDRKFITSDGRELYGFTAQAIGIESLIRGAGIRQPMQFRFAGARVYGMRVFDALGAIAGIGVAMILWRRTGFRVAALVLLVVVTVAIVLGAFRYQYRIYLPFVAVIAMVFASELSAGVQRMRHAARRLV